ncbi:MAG: insulinase family protein [bacterium]|nr:insulinase family protein [bacterium]
MSSRLFQNIREKEGLCYYINAGHYSGSYKGDFFIRSGLEKQRFDFGLEKIIAEIDNFAQSGPQKEEFEKAKGYLLGQIQMGIESSDEMAEFLGSQYILYQNIISLEETIAIYQNMKLEDVLPYSSSLKKDHLYVYWID